MKSDIEGVSISWGSLKGKWPPPEESDTVLCKTDTALHMMRVSLHVVWQHIRSILIIYVNKRTTALTTKCTEIILDPHNPWFKQNLVPIKLATCACHDLTLYLGVGNWLCIKINSLTKNVFSLIAWSEYIRLLFQSMKQIFMLSQKI